MKKAKLLFGENEPREEIKTRIPVWLYPSTLEVIDRAAETVNCKSRSEYLERAALFYAGYISGQDATAYLPPALSKVMRGIVRDTENRICRLLFKLAVELDMVMNLLAAAMEIPEARHRECEKDQRQHYHGGCGGLPGRRPRREKPSSLGDLVDSGGKAGGPPRHVRPW